MIIGKEFDAIKQLFTINVFNRGLAYFQDDRVHSLSFNRLERTWFAEVIGTKVYYVEIVLPGLGDDDDDVYCDCPAFATYGECKHIVAVLLEMSTQNLFNSGLEEGDLTERFIDRIISSKSRESVEVIDKVPMQVEYIITFDYRNRVHLQLKTGIDHRYVVHHIRELLEEVFKDNG